MRLHKFIIRFFLFLDSTPALYLQFAFVTELADLIDFF